MDFSQLKQLALPIALLTLVGCASVPKSTDNVSQPSSDVANAVGAAAIGDSVQLPANHSLGMTSVVVDRTYFAASGRECRRLRNASGAPIQQVACKGSDGLWRFARDLRPVSAVQIQNRSVALNNTADSSVNAKPLIPSSGSALLLNEDGTLTDSALQNDNTVLIINDSAQSDVQAVELIPNVATDLVQRELQANETLWSFAKRTTGNALNWQAIADINNIVNTNTLAPGVLLNIPAALVGEGG